MQRTFCVAAHPLNGFDLLSGPHPLQTLHNHPVTRRLTGSDQPLVFNSPVKRRKLEAFTHAAIFEAYRGQVDQLTAADPEAIIQAAVPLLMELNLQSLFDKVLVVYITPAQQLERLTARDGITAEEAARILATQLPIDDKIGSADYVIDNGGTLEETRQQVEMLWRRL